MKAPIQASKHYIQKSLSTVLAGQLGGFDIAKAVALQSVNIATEVAEGSVIKAVFVELWVRAGDTSPGAVLVSLLKTSGDISITFAEQTALNDFVQKKNVLYHTQGLTNDQDADAIPFVRQWFKIPKGKQRFGLGDKLTLAVSAQALDAIICGFAIYKEYN